MNIPAPAARPPTFSISGVPLAHLRELLAKTERVIAQYVAGNNSEYYIRTYTEIADDLKAQIVAHPTQAVA